MRASIPSPALRFPRKPFAGPGFTLLEILVAMAILSVVVLAIYRLHAQSLAATQAARFQTIAPLLARLKLAEAELNGLDGSHGGEGEFGERYPGYTWRLVVDDVASQMLGEVGEGLKRIEVSIIFEPDDSVYRVQTYRFFQVRG